ncbi:hypothetical protein C8J57DRAFT_1569561 [Mycena rebaudengoi]|nr:hypothetical protein C8J57DRAFT_1569561 [Mycena rebaudengoi]
MHPPVPLISSAISPFLHYLAISHTTTTYCLSAPPTSTIPTLTLLPLYSPLHERPSLAPLSARPSLGSAIAPPHIPFPVVSRPALRVIRAVRDPENARSGLSQPRIVHRPQFRVGLPHYRYQANEHNNVWYPHLLDLKTSSTKNDENDDDNQSIETQGTDDDDYSARQLDTHCQKFLFCNTAVPVKMRERNRSSKKTYPKNRSRKNAGTNANPLNHISSWTAAKLSQLPNTGTHETCPPMQPRYPTTETRPPTAKVFPGTRRLRHPPVPDNPATPATRGAAAASTTAAHPSAARRPPPAACCLPVNAPGAPVVSYTTLPPVYFCGPRCLCAPPRATSEPRIISARLCLRLLSNAFTTTATVSNPPACVAAHWPPLVLQPLHLNSPLPYPHYPSKFCPCARSRLTTPNLRPRRTALATTTIYIVFHAYPSLKRLCTPKTGPTVHILRLPTPLTFFCEPGCALLRTHAPVPLDDQPHRNLCQKSALTGTTVPPTALRSAAAMDSALHLQFDALCRRFGLESEVEGWTVVYDGFWAVWIPQLLSRPLSPFYTRTLRTNFTEFKTPHHSQFLCRRAYCHIRPPFICSLHLRNSALALLLPHVLPCCVLPRSPSLALRRQGSVPAPSPNRSSGPALP